MPRGKDLWERIDRNFGELRTLLAGLRESLDGRDAPMTMRLIPQRGKHDCGVATMAMLLGMTYEEAESSIPYHCGDPAPWDEAAKRGVNPIDILWVGLRRGAHLAVVTPLDVFVEAWGESGRHLMAPDQDEFWQWVSGRPAVFSVKMINGDGFHSVAWDGASILDPMCRSHPPVFYQPGDRPEIIDAVVRLDVRGER